MGLDPDDIQAWLWAKGATGTCDVCGENKWLWIGDRERGKLDRLLLITVNDDGTTSPDEGLTVVAMGCGTCGSLRLFSPDVIATGFVPDFPPEE